MISYFDFIPVVICVCIVEVSRFFIKPVTDKKDHTTALRNVIVAQFAVILCLVVWLVWALARAFN